MIEIKNTTKSRINLKSTKNFIKNFLVWYFKRNKNFFKKRKVKHLEDLEISLAFVGDRVIRRLNKKYRRLDRVTDVLSFPGEGAFLGEIIIDYAQIKRQTNFFSKSIKEEFEFILVHGLLHLCGYEDKTQKGKIKMEKLGKEFIRQTINYDKN